MPIAETIRGFKEIIEGRHVELPEGVFFMQCGIDEVVDSLVGQKAAHEQNGPVMSEGPSWVEALDINTTEDHMGPGLVLMPHDCPAVLADVEMTVEPMVCPNVGREVPSAASQVADGIW